MEIEVSRRKFLQGSVALTVLGGIAVNPTQSLFAGEEKSRTGGATRSVPTLCEMCVNKCAAIAHVEGGIIKKLDPNPAFPKSRNMLCARGVAGIHALYDPDRLKYPLIRIGKRGEGKFRRATWEEAYEAILNGTKDFKGLAQILDEEKDNRSTIGYCAGEGMAEHTFKSFIADKIGSSNFVNHASICLQTTVSGYALTIGAYGQSDLEHADYVIMAGANRAEAIVTPDTMDMFKRTRGRGAQLICVDPRFSHTAALADEWIPIRVGSDLAWVLALTWVAIKEGLYNKKFVETNVNGFDAYKKHILDHDYTPEWAETITGIPAETTVKVAREFMAAAPRAVYYQGRRTAWSYQDFQLRRAQAIFTALGGGVDVKGGIIFGKKLPLGDHEINAPMYAQARSRIDKDVAAIVGGAGSWIGWRNKIIEGKSPYPIRAMFTYKQNPMLSVPDVTKTRKLFEQMDLVVTIDTMPGDTVMMSDVVLPESTYLEREDPVRSFGGAEPSIALRQSVIDPMYETRPVHAILKGLAEKLSEPLWAITRKYDEDVQDELEDKKPGEIREYYSENGFDLTDMFHHSQEEINKEMVVAKHGEDAWEVLRREGVYYPEMKEHLKKSSANTWHYYPEAKKHYTVRKQGFDSSIYSEACIDEKELTALAGKLKTQSGKVECTLPALAKKGVDPMPTWQPKFFHMPPAGTFRFISGRHAQFTQNSTQNNALLLDLMRENHLWIHAEQAKELRVGFGDLVEVASVSGKVHIKAYPTTKIIKDTVFFVHGFGAQSDGMTLAHRNGAADNILIGDAIEPVFGVAAMHETDVTITKVVS
jgi:thiosulfate reductase/polysulfide reductase chain A